MTGRFTDKVALISGGGSGIGAATARRIVSEGGRVVLTGRRAEALDIVAAQLGGASAAVAVAGDAADANDVRHALAVALDRFRQLDIVIANAGGLGTGAVGATDDEQWAASMRSNVTTCFVTAREALPFLRDRGGAIVVVSSIAGLAAAPQMAGYVTAKHALTGLTRSLAYDYGRDGIRVNAVCPGWVRTPMADAEMDDLAAQRSLASRDEAYALVTRDTMLARPARADEIAAVCCFLASDDASIMTGAIVAADAGATAIDLPTVALRSTTPTTSTT